MTCSLVYLLGPKPLQCAELMKAQCTGLEFRMPRYGGWSPERVAIHSQLYAGPGDSFEDGVPLSGEWAVNDWISRGASVTWKKPLA